ncbi:hypothetical protein [Nocardia callitridis]|uniref:Class I SAM-dependent methyltransferase n=1 Tax=Nocardia callitridis TaxID=648753 RepID=A0ABP9KYN4_9NOCA
MSTPPPGKHGTHAGVGGVRYTGSAVSRIDRVVRPHRSALTTAADPRSKSTPTGDNRAMADFVLSTERRGELAELLGDEHLLRTRYPRVAEYLDAAPRLPGTGDESADAAFDLRLVHYLTGGASENPYWDIVAPSVGDDGARRVVNGGRPRGSARLAFAQTILQTAYAYAIPAPETLDWVAEFADGAEVVELGAGRGYLARQLTRIGVTTAAYDAEPPDTTSNPSFPRAAGQPQAWQHVGDLTEFAKQPLADRVLLLCWPPGWGDPMASRALHEFEQAGGERLVFLGEPHGGKTGDDGFFARLDSAWSLKSSDAHYVSWWNLNDVAQAWQRRK